MSKGPLVWTNWTGRMWQPGVITCQTWERVNAGVLACVTKYERKEIDIPVSSTFAERQVQSRAPAVNLTASGSQGFCW